MEKRFILSCESTIDLPYTFAQERELPVLPYTYTVDGTVYTDDMRRDPQSLPRFYEMIEAGSLPSTSQLNTSDYEEFFDRLLAEGDVLHIAFGSGMTNSVANALIAADVIRTRHPEHKLIVIDSLCSCGGYGLLVREAADRRDEGLSIEETEACVLSIRNRVHHQFFCTDLKFFRRSGRVSGISAVLASVLNICPIMHLNAAGRIVLYGKVRGRRNALKRTLDEMALHADGGEAYAGPCIITHANCLSDGEELRAQAEERFPALKGRILLTDIGPVIASHCGPGTLAIYVLGDERVE